MYQMRFSEVSGTHFNSSPASDSFHVLPPFWLRCRWGPNHQLLTAAYVNFGFRGSWTRRLTSQPRKKGPSMSHRLRSFERKVKPPFRVPTQIVIFDLPVRINGICTLRTTMVKGAIHLAQGHGSGR